MVKRKSTHVHVYDRLLTALEQNTTISLDPHKYAVRLTNEKSQANERPGRLAARLRECRLTLNCTGVSSVLKSGVEAILSSRVCRNTFWKSSISGRLPNKLSIWKQTTSGLSIYTNKAFRTAPLTNAVITRIIFQKIFRWLRLLIYSSAAGASSWSGWWWITGTLDKTRQNTLSCKVLHRTINSSPN